MPVSACPFSRLLTSADALRARKGWSRFLAAFALGTLTALAFAPENFFPVLWISFPGLIFLLRGTENAKQAFITGWGFAFGAFVFGFYWIAASMFVDIRQFWWAVPLSVAGLPAFFALYYGIAAGLARRLGLEGLKGTLLFALLWFLADYARGHVFGGFPWNLEGYAWMRVLPLMQVVSVIGIYGLTLLTLIAASLPACLGEGESSRNRRIVFLSLFALCLIGLGGEIRLLKASEDTVPDVRLRIVQPNVDQAHKWLPEQREANFRELIALSSAPAAKPVTAIVWPETAATFYLAEDIVHRQALAAHIPEGGTVLTGVIRRIVEPDRQIHYYNALIAIDALSNVVAAYNKTHLVPFGEFVPLRHILPTPALVNLGLDFSAGDGPRTLRVEGLPPFSPFICYEAIFPGAVVDKNDRPAFLLNITNDGWYGKTAGPYQHFSEARTRAIEEGLPLVRAANTGISSIVDAYGRVRARLSVGKTGFIDGDLPRPLAPTFFSRTGETFTWVFFALVGCFCIGARRKP